MRFSATSSWMKKNDGDDYENVRIICSESFLVKSFNFSFQTASFIKTNQHFTESYKALDSRYLEMSFNLTLCLKSC